ncbi:MAG: prepilin-type N-terminal cleavage/methylation domain-containing protein [Phycisphaerae bacterium]|nr:prepilin-type N-terminal cleavage/methylation domain-containing protein [Phycisphaerae bacterium]
MRKQRGLSLVEVVVAIVIVGLAAPPLLFQIANGVRQQEAVLIQQNLVQLASERMWEIFTDHANPTRSYDYITAAAYPDETAPRALEGYQRQTEVREVSPADYVSPQAGSGIKRFRITVTGPAQHSLVIESFVTNVPGAKGPD